MRGRSLEKSMISQVYKNEVVIVIEIPIVISEVIFGVETESGLRIARSRQAFE